MRISCCFAGACCFAGLYAAQQQDKPRGDATRGKAVFETVCAECHYPDSREVLVGPGLQGLKAGKLPNGKPATREKLLDIVNSGPAEMPSFQDRLTEQQKLDVVAFVMTL